MFFPDTAEPQPNRELAQLQARDEMGLEWYYNGQLQCGQESFGFALAFFRTSIFRRELPLPLRWLLSLRFARGLFLSHFSLLEFRTGRFHYSHQRHSRRFAGAARDRFQVWCGDWSIDGDADAHRLMVQTRQAELSLRLTPLKPLVKHGSDGWMDKGGQQGFHCSYPRLGAEGTLRLAKETRPVRGEAWMDREFGNWQLRSSLRGWDWCSVQLDNACELMVYFFRDAAGHPAPASFVTVVDRECRAEELSLYDFSWTPQQRWKSPWTGTEYPQSWTLRIPKLDLELEIVPVCQHQEVDTRGSMMVVYWEGAATAHGHIGARSVEGKAYVELFGYDGSHRSLSLGKWMAWERKRRKHGSERILE